MVFTIKRKDTEETLLNITVSDIINIDNTHKVIITPEGNLKVLNELSGIKDFAFIEEVIYMPEVEALYYTECMNNAFKKSSSDRRCIFQSIWNKDIIYKLDDVVTLSGKSYVYLSALQERGVVPGESPSWALFDGLNNASDSTVEHCITFIRNTITTFVEKYDDMELIEE